MNGGLVLAQEYGIGVYGNGASFVMKDGVISTVDNAAVAGNGSCTNSVNYGGTEIEISGGTLIGHITTPGYIANAIYHPQSGVLNITGGTIYADNGLGVLMRNGELNISGSVSIIATGDQSGQLAIFPLRCPETLWSLITRRGITITTIRLTRERFPFPAAASKPIRIRLR